eukprot:CAMPEP_0174238942 /NCGR_PEP_ID=MMETSP0417-20130205/13017_1 /TAXON_ID=242541 /ORGANISM="Mayorella sp, Strain BSH-02190019" /LENGTH=93 /DNA_ID=CAMNT_0015317833 /DNA_START=27 /DNA_END=308 /DNA_ORIENTATION=+
MTLNHTVNNHAAEDLLITVHRKATVKAIRMSIFVGTTVHLAVKTTQHNRIGHTGGLNLKGVGHSDQSHEGKQDKRKFHCVSHDEGGGDVCAGR